MLIYMLNFWFQLLEPYKDKFTETYKAMLEELEEHINASDDRDYYVYSGTAGLSSSLNLISNSTVTHFHFME